MGNFISEDLLIRSHKEIQRNILPFMHMMSCYQNMLKDAANLSSYKSKYGGGGFGNGNGAYRHNGSKFSELLLEDESRDNTV
jgi:hypothetical protein